MGISEKVAYIKGLAEGMNFDGNTNEGKLILAMLDVLGDVASALDDIDSDIEDMDEAISDIEEAVYDLEDAVFEDDEDEDDECGCEDCMDDGEMYELECPTCHNTITADYEIISKGTINCPNCGENLEFDLDSLEDE